MLFLLFFILVIGLSFLGSSGCSRGYLSIFYRVALVFTLSYLVGMGGDLYNDHYNYKSIYKNIDSIKLDEISGIGNFFFDKYILSEFEGSEWGFILLLKLFKILGFSSVGMFFTIAIITNSLIVSSYYRFNEPTFAFLIYISSSIYFQEANLIRQTLAMSIFCYSLKYIVDKRLGKYLILCLLAFLFHRASMLMLVFAPLCLKEKHYTNYLKYFLFGLWVVSIIISLKIIRFDLSFITLSFIALDGYDAYLTDENVIGGSQMRFNIVNNILALLFFFVYNRNKSKDIYAILFIIGIVIANISVQIVNFERLGFYFYVVFPVFIPYLLEITFSKRKIVTIKPFVYSVAFLYYIIIFTKVSFSQSEYLGKNLHTVLELFD